jgi:hypothetical protein
MNRTLRVVALLVGVALLAAACPKPEEVGHAPKQQIDMAKDRLDAASAKTNAALNDAARAADETK